MKSWEKYYQEFNGKLSASNHLIISLLDNDESIKIITQLGYKFDPQGKTLKDCKVGSYYFWNTEVNLDPMDEEETFVETIDIHHLLTEEHFFEIESREIDFGHPFVEKWFGIKTKYIVNLAAMYIKV
ncbi:hypothetical protein OAZ92_00400 [Prochlorococcus sp. AH-736-E02]|nr:hypothetical protein [Prochlorococcus sp. AH-736-E02]